LAAGYSLFGGGLLPRGNDVSTKKVAAFASDVGKK
jgi:hypothetical protein